MIYDGLTDEIDIDDEIIYDGLFGLCFYTVNSYTFRDKDSDDLLLILNDTI